MVLVTTSCKAASADDLMFGNAGEDTFVGGAGLDTIDGGDGYDQILIEGTSASDAIIGHFQSAAGTT